MCRIVPSRAMQASGPRRDKAANRLSGLQIALQDLATGTIGGSGIAAHSAPVRRHPQKASSDRDAAGVMRFGIDFMEHFSGPVDQVGAFRYLLGNPQAFTGVLQTVWMAFGRLEELCDGFRLADRN